MAILYPNAGPGQAAFEMCMARVLDPANFDYVRKPQSSYAEQKVDEPIFGIIREPKAGEIPKEGTRRQRQPYRFINGKRYFDRYKRYGIK